MKFWSKDSEEHYFWWCHSTLLNWSRGSQTPGLKKS